VTARIYAEEAELYDIAFGWDASADADWLVERLGQDCRTVLEPGCGTGRMLAALSERGLDVSGIDLSEAMVAGEVVEDLHTTAYWTHDTWREAIDASPLEQVARYDTALPGRPAVEPTSGGYLWHELVAA
jgi:SAM-dependent methyltransferase